MSKTGMEGTATEKPAKKKLLKVKVPTHLKPSGGAGYSNLPKDSAMFSMIGCVKDGERSQCMPWTYCRETLIRQASENISGIINNTIKDETQKLDLDALRLLILFQSSDAFKKRLFNGKSALNAIEEMAGWEGRSVITTVNHEVYEKNVWLVTGPKEWILYPQMLSLATWILRLAAKYDSIKADNFDILEQSIKKVTGTTSDVNYAKSFWDKTYILTKFQKEIFGDMSLKNAWVTTNSSEVGVYGGIVSFCDGAKGSKEYSGKISAAFKRFNALCGKHLPRGEE